MGHTDANAEKWVNVDVRGKDAARAGGGDKHADQPHRARLIRTTYEVVTPESAAEGEATERGWVDEAGYVIEPDADDVEQYGDILAAVVGLVEKYIGVGVEASDYPCCNVGHTWYTEIDVSIDYRTGAETRRSWHLEGFSADEQEFIYEVLTAR